MTNKLVIEIETHDRALDWALMGNPSSLSVGDQVAVPGGGALVWQGGMIRKAVGIPQVFEFLLTFGAGVSSSMIGTYLYERLKGRATTLRIDRREVMIEEGEITRVIEEHIEKKE